MQDTDDNKETSKGEPPQHGEAPPPSVAKGLPQAMPEGFGDDDYYFNDSGFVVFTAKYLLERGYCCGNGCKNCPYDYKAVPEPRRTKLLEQRKNDESK